MNSYLLNRSQGSISPSSFHAAQSLRLIQNLAPAPGIQFSSTHSEDDTTSTNVLSDAPAVNNEFWAHKAGVNVLAIDQYEKRFMVSGGADGSIHLWDLESRGADLTHIHKSVASVSKADSSAHTHSLTSLSIYPFDPTPSTILTTSHDATLKLSSVASGSIVPVHTFSLHSTPYSHSLSANATSHVLIAVGTSDKAVRLLDLRSGLSTHSLPGHSSAVLSVHWAPHNPYLLASGSKDNKALIFDIRRGANSSVLASLDMHDAVGVLPPRSAPPDFIPRSPYSPQSTAHIGPVTGVRWTPSGSHLLTSGHDSHIRLWDAQTGANTLLHFGPRIRNAASTSTHLAERAPLILPALETGSTPIFLWPNASDSPNSRGEIFIFSIQADGSLLAHLKVPGPQTNEHRNTLGGRPSALTAARINALAWRGNGGSGEGMELYSAHGDGMIRCWASRTEEDVDEVEAEQEEQAREDRKRKRDVLEEVYRGLMEPGIKFT